MTEVTDIHEWEIPEVGASEDVWGNILNNLFDGDLEEQVVLDGLLSNRPNGSSSPLKFYHASDEGVMYYNNNGTWEAISGGTSGGSENLSFISSHSNWDFGLTNKEFHRFSVPSGNSYEVTSIEFQERGGGSSNPNASVRVFDVSNSSIIESADLNTRSETGGVSSDGATIVFELTNGTGSRIDAGITIRAKVV